MPLRFRRILLCSPGLLLSGAVLAGPADPCAIDTKVGTNGTVELSNVGHTAKCEVAGTTRAPNAAATQAAPAPAAAAAASPTAEHRDASPAAGPSTAADAPSSDQKDRRESYRDAVLTGEPGTTGSNPAVSRRYKMMDKATYQSKVLNGAAPASDPGAAAPQ